MRFRSVELLKESVFSFDIIHEIETRQGSDKRFRV